MYLADGWQDFEILDAGNGDKLERWGSYTLLRPDPQAVWPMGEHRADAVYFRSQSGGGHWEFQRDLPESWLVRYKGLTFVVRPTGFKHTGLFPEQAVNWDFMSDRLSAWRKAHSEAPRVLNLFAYTGGATCACAKAGAQVVHVDAAKGMVSWAKDNDRGRLPQVRPPGAAPGQPVRGHPHGPAQLRSGPGGRDVEDRNQPLRAGQRVRQTPFR